MGLQLNNITALNAIRHLNTSYSKLDRVTRELITGRRMGDPVVTSLSTRITSDIAAINQKITDINLEVSMNQTAEGSLGTVSDMLVEMRSLAQQALLGAHSQNQLEALDEEYQALAAQVTDTLNSATFNGNSLLTGSEALVQLNLSPALGIDLTNLQQNDLAYISTGI
ncbi:MAG: flagellin, partial [Planctomycetota bacterium]